MNGIDTFLIQYGLVAVFLIMLIKSVGVPIPIPGDLVILAAAARVAQGKLNGWQVFVALCVALVLGGLIQYLLARGPGRGLLYRLGRYIGLTAPRIEAASRKIKKGGRVGVAVAMLVPGVRGAAIVASGLADLSVTRFLTGLVAGSVCFVSLHFFIGLVGGSALIALSHVVPLPLPVLVILVAVLLAIAFALWRTASRRPKLTSAEEEDRAQSDAAAALEVWHEGICPACLALYTVSQIRTFTENQFPI